MTSPIRLNLIPAPLLDERTLDLCPDVSFFHSNFTSQPAGESKTEYILLGTTMLYLFLAFFILEPLQFFTHIHANWQVLLEKNSKCYISIKSIYTAASSLEM